MNTCRLYVTITLHKHNAYIPVLSFANVFGKHKIQSELDKDELRQMFESMSDKTYRRHKDGSLIIDSNEMKIRMKWYD